MRDLSQLQILSPPSELECVNHVASTDSGYARSLSGEELANQLIRWLKLLPVGSFLADCTPNEREELTKASTYVNFRLTAQQALLCVNDDSEISIVSSIIGCVRSLAGPGFDESLSSIFQNFKILQRINNYDLQEALHTLVSRIQRRVETKSLKAVRKQDPARVSEPTINKSSADGLVDSVKDLTLKKLSQVPIHRLERCLRVVLGAKLDHDWRFKEEIVREVSEGESSEHKNGVLILEMLELLNLWRLDHGNVQRTLSLNERVGWTGRCALICEHLMFIDPEFLSTPHFASLFEDKISCNDRFVSFMPRLALDFIIHNSSWQSISRILKVILGVFIQQDGNIRKGEKPDTSESSLVYCVHEEVGIVDMYLKKLQRTKVLDEASSVLEFILLCVQHPRTILACRLNEDLGSSVSIYSQTPLCKSCVAHGHVNRSFREDVNSGWESNVLSTFTNLIISICLVQCRKAARHFFPSLILDLQKLW